MDDDLAGAPDWIRNPVPCPNGCERPLTRMPGEEQDPASVGLWEHTGRFACFSCQLGDPFSQGIHSTTPKPPKRRFWQR